MNGPTITGRDAAGDGRLTWADVGACFEAGLLETKSDRGRPTLENAHEAIQALRREGVRITFAEVGGRCRAKHGTPTAQSIQNNKRAADLVNMAAAVQAADARPRAGGRSEEAEVLDLVGVPALRARLEGWLAHRRALITETNGLREAFRRTEAIVFLTRQMAEAGVEDLERLVAAVREARAGGLEFIEEERAACRAFLDGGMAASGLSLDEPSGEIVDRSMRTVARRGVAAVLRRVADCRRA
jgi:hypothetical protein